MRTFKLFMVPGMSGISAHASGAIYMLKSRIWMELSQFNRVRGYRGVKIHGTDWLVHRLVLMAFQGPPPSDKHEGLHLDNDRTNNSISNLCWGTHLENMRMDRGNNHSHQGESNRNSKLSIKEVVEIREAYQNRASSFWGRRSLAKKFGISENQVSRIAQQLPGGWSHV